MRISETIRYFVEIILKICAFRRFENKKNLLLVYKTTMTDFQGNVSLYEIAFFYYEHNVTIKYLNHEKGFLLNFIHTLLHNFFRRCFFVTFCCCQQLLVLEWTAFLLEEKFYMLKYYILCYSRYAVEAIHTENNAVQKFLHG